MATRKFQQDGFTVTVSRIPDEDPDVSYLAQDYSDYTATERICQSWKAWIYVHS
jgi:hypothetical protein